jgi:TolA-binding protein
MASPLEASHRNRTFLKTGVLGILLLLAAGCDRTPKSIVADAEARWRQGDYLGAVQAYEHLVDDYPKSVYADDSYYAMGTIEYLYLNDYPKAVEAFRKVVTDHPGSPLVMKAQRTLAEIYEKKYHDPRRAVAEYQSILDRTRNRAAAEEIQYRIGEVYFDQGDFDQARNEWEQLLGQSPKGEWSDNALYRTGSSYYLEGRYSDALATYQQAVKRFPDSDVSVEIRFSMASCYEELDRWDDALREYRSLAESYPNPRVIQLKIKNAETRMKTITAHRPPATDRSAEPE